MQNIMMRKREFLILLVFCLIIGNNCGVLPS